MFLSLVESKRCSLITHFVTLAFSLYACVFIFVNEAIGQALTVKVTQRKEKAKANSVRTGDIELKPRLRDNTPSVGIRGLAYLDDGTTIFACSRSTNVFELTSKDLSVKEKLMPLGEGLTLFAIPSSKPEWYAIAGTGQGQR